MENLVGFDPALMKIYPDVWTKPFWDAAREHRLVCAQCVQCKTFRMPPAFMCWKCRSREMDYVEIPGLGTVFTFTIIRHALIPEARAAVPYVVATVSLDGAPGTRLITNIVGCEPEAVRIDMPVEVVFNDISPEQTLVCFRPRAA